jgi:hypothetical protein
MPFHHPILLWIIVGGEMAFHTLLSSVSTELHGCKLPPPPHTHMIGVEDLQFLACLNFNTGLKVLDL